MSIESRVHYIRNEYHAGNENHVANDYHAAYFVALANVGENANQRLGSGEIQLQNTTVQRSQQ